MTAALVTAGAWLAAYQMYRALSLLWFSPRQDDFAQYWTAARMSLADGLPAVYDVARYGPAISAFRGQTDAFSTSPPVIWLATPLAGLPYRVALYVWVALLVAVIVWATWTAASGGGIRRGGLVLAALGCFPIAFAITLGQASLLVDGLIVLHWWLLRSRRPALAGIALGLAFLKPQDVLLVPVALLLTGRWRSAAACAATAIGLAAASVLALGPAGLHGYEHSVAVQLAREFITRHTLSGQLPVWVPILAVRAIVTGIALVPALFAGARRYELALGGAVVGSLLVTPYLNAEDFGALFVCGLLVLRTHRAAWVAPAMLASYATMVFLNWTGPKPLVAMEVLWLLALAALALRPALGGYRAEGAVRPPRPEAVPNLTGA